ncbi:MULTISPECIES: L7Ae/L30e/S12e/Gadd45 family ribosomal protein [Dellaglioa]|uniref:Ribosomal protein eL8/eL30/eS12/Gadd45 domain-containing protein n=3 Tax=Dellaglioa TaxID=2767880 RepID=A0A0R1HKE4_9LACO|nr:MULTISPECIES: ribosomal L7Ae/L30e/S12e/Gadd45 family protein [Dellaglioa]KRK46680.1 hypothetical protein FC66_GL000304 [Dellaglioa algida DSM 15638]MCZ2490858.1 ribosomal L7Ae/L30e/S12e/Gadd45 family protein [Dellaglioa carnosa]MCZ2492503.1 ribosomal L7Ae/L30e/S12e/Gadd45 family protein [Dellaglioa carnosa]MCZ2493936.1 ribosomal L7Ae/L30e/S12e/Gadd45 family protein [Dellaglioa carnosa]MDK1716453.1 ribosomal L7Ae/L30e/S12e/Gadd45 family protein [Dellaglioa algida]
MENSQKFLQMLGLTRRAGMLVTGEGLVLNAVRKNKAKLVILSEDCGQATLKKVTDKCNSYNVKLYVGFSKAILSEAVGQQRTVYAITDKGFSRRMCDLMDI